jgi:hypothetical protein
MGVLCFTRRVRRTRVPKGFKLPHDQQKYDGSQEPTLWLSDYLQAVQILGGTRATVLVEHYTQRFHWELGRTRKPIRKKFSLNVQMPNVSRRNQVVRIEKKQNPALLYTMLERNQKFCRRRL